MGDRKYRQRGYLEDEYRDREEGKRESRRETVPRGQAPLAPKSPRMPGFREVIRCYRCGHELRPPVGTLAACPRCGARSHCCAQCAYFDTSARFECAQPIPARIAPKDAPNECTFFEPRVTVERETKTSGPADARKAFEDLFR
jgi:hypothetical protein